MADGVDLMGWKIPSLPLFDWGPVDKQLQEIIRALKNLAKKAESVITAQTAKV